jgi:hypothetical protein
MVGLIGHFHKYAFACTRDEGERSTNWWAHSSPEKRADPICENHHRSSAGRTARFPGGATIQYCAQNLHIAPVFGPNSLAVSPRLGHLHVRLDDAPWVWADASGNPIILYGSSSGPAQGAS